MSIRDDSNFLDFYIREISKYPLLNKEEELELARQIGSGAWAKSRLKRFSGSRKEKSALRLKVQRGEAARQKLICSNLRLVMACAKRFVCSNVGYAELINEGNHILTSFVNRIANINDRRRFDWRRNCRFVTFVYRRLNWDLYRYARDQRLIQVPDYLFEIKKGRHRRQLLEYASRQIIMASQMSRRAEKESPFEFLDQRSTEPWEEASVRENNLNLSIALESVGQNFGVRNLEIIKIRFGLNDCQEHTLEYIGRRFGISKERVRQIIKKILNWIRENNTSLRAS